MRRPDLSVPLAERPSGLRGRDRRAGIEQEFAVARGSEQVDFGEWARAGRLTGRALDRADPHAHRQPCGGVITADGREAEIATSPAVLRPGFSVELTAALADLRFRLAGIAGHATVTGVSTHLNVEVDDKRVARCADRFARRHAAAMMLMLDRCDSPGLLVRPRRGRLELGGEYAVGTQLAAAAVLGAAATLESDLRRGASRPRALASPVLEPARERFGWYVDRGAYGVDLYREGRRARIGSHRAQDLLTWSWEASRPLAEPIASAHEIALVDRVVDGAAPLPCEQPAVEPSAGPARVAGVDLTLEHCRGELVLRPVVLTWEHAVFELGDAHRRTVVVAVPADAAQELVGSFLDGRLGSWCRHVLEGPARALPVLVSQEQIGAGGVFGTLAHGVDLMAPERDAVTGLIGGSGGASREHKQESHTDPPRGPRRGRRLRQLRHGRLVAPVLAGVLAAVLVVGAVGGVALVRHRDQVAADAARVRADKAAAARRAEAKRAAALATVATARSFAGSYAVTSVVSKGNPTSPTGTTNRYRTRVRVACDSEAACTVDVGAGRQPLAGNQTHFVNTIAQPCPTGKGTAGVRRVFDLSFAQDTFSGTVRSSAVDISHCPGVHNIPIVETLTAHSVG